MYESLDFGCLERGGNATLVLDDVRKPIADGTNSERTTCQVTPLNNSVRTYSIVLKHSTHGYNNKIADPLVANYHIEFLPSERMPSGIAVVHEDCAIRYIPSDGKPICAKLFGINAIGRKGDNNPPFFIRPSRDFIDVIETAPERVSPDFGTFMSQVGLGYNAAVNVLQKAGLVEGVPTIKKVGHAYELVCEFRLKEISNYLKSFDAKAFAQAFLNKTKGVKNG